MEQTTNLGLKKPAENENYGVAIQNENMDKIDDAVGTLSNGSIVLNGNATKEITLEMKCTYILFNSSNVANICCLVQTTNMSANLTHLVPDHNITVELTSGLGIKFINTTAYNAIIGILKLGNAGA